MLRMVAGEGGPFQYEVLIVWTLLAAALFGVAYQRKRLD
jgi:hypothetical protein